MSLHHLSLFKPKFLVKLCRCSSFGAHQNPFQWMLQFKKVSIWQHGNMGILAVTSVNIWMNSAIRLNKNCPCIDISREGVSPKI